MAEPPPSLPETPSARPLPPLLELTRARLLEFLREPAALFWVFGFPVLLALGLGLAFRDRPPEPVAVGVPAAGAPWIEAAITEAEGLVAVPLAVGAEVEAVAEGRVDVAVVPAPGSPEGAESMGGPEPGGEPAADPRFEMVLDSTRPTARLARLAAWDALERALGRQDVATVSAREVTEQGSRYIDFLIPGLIGLNLMGSSMWGIGFQVVRSRVAKLLKRFAATPMARSDYLLSLVLSRLVFLVAELAALVLAGWALFGVGVEGSLLTLLIVATAGGMAFTGLALLVAARPTNAETAAGWMNLVMLPMWLLSGSFFPYTRFPEALHPILSVLPLSAVNDGLRAVMGDGAGLGEVMPQLLVLAAWGAVSFLLALRLFRWR